MTSAPAPWWRDAVVYQIYPRSFADSDADGIGDVAGMTARLPHIAALGADAVWISPWYASPMVDGGYDVADHCALHPDFGTLADADAFVAAAHDLGLRVLLDLVPNHTSDAHPWFAAALASAPGSPERARYHFRDGRGPGGNVPPTNWGSLFGGPAWRRVTETDGRPGQWYLHMFAAEQPDLNWANPEVAEEFDRILRFWFDRGVDGFRIDVADSLAKDEAMPDTEPLESGYGSYLQLPGHPLWNRPELAAIQARWRAVADSYDPPRMFVSEANSPDKLTYLAPGRLHTTFVFDSVWCAWDASSQRHMIGAALAQHAAAGVAPTWVLGNHDVPRVVTRYGKALTGWRWSASGPVPPLTWGEHLYPWPTDVARGRRRARAAALLVLALPGGAYVYQGDELGLEEVEDLPIESLADPVFRRTNGRLRGRDGCRVPLPWSGVTPPFGFSDAAAWLPQPAAWAALTAEAQAGDPDSTLTLYRRALRLRRELPALGDGELAWADRWDPDAVLAFTREPGFGCVVNFGTEPAALPPGARVLLASAPLDAAGRLPQDAAAWYATTPGPLA